MSVKLTLLVLAVFGPLCSSASTPFTVDKWKVRVVTADEQYAGTNADVFLTIYGKTADGQTVKSQEVNLDNDNNNFERGSIDEFEIETVHVGQPFQIVIRQNNRGTNASWKLNYVEILNSETGELYKFPFYNWLSEESGLSKTIFADSFEAENWQVAVYTARAFNAGTDANVYLTIFGNRPDGIAVKTDKIKLDSEKNNFEIGEVDYFRIETITLGKPYQITIGHDNTGRNAAWELDRVELRNLATNEVFAYTFECQCWLDEGAGLEKTLQVEK